MRGAGRFRFQTGKFVYYTKDWQVRTRLWKVPVGGGEETQVLESHNFSVTPQGIYFIQAPDRDYPDRSYLLRFFDFASERVKTITSLPTSVAFWGGISISPDGRFMLYTQVDQSESDLMLVENFR